MQSMLWHAIHQRGKLNSCPSVRAHRHVATIFDTPAQWKEKRDELYTDQVIHKLCISV